MIEFIGPSYNWIQQFTNHYLTHCHLLRLDILDIWPHYTNPLLLVKVKVTLRLTVSQSVGFGFEPHLRLMTRYLLIFDSYGLVFMGRPLWREDRSVFCICCWSLPTQSFSGPSPLGLATIFYCLRFETSLFVASYDSQGHGEGIWPRLHTGMSIPAGARVSHSCISSSLTSRKTRPFCNNGRLLLSRVVVGISQQRVVYQESVSAGTSLSSRYLAVDLYVTMYKIRISSGVQ
jgi:hypothetical protein